MIGELEGSCFHSWIDGFCEEIHPGLTDDSPIRWLY